MYEHKILSVRLGWVIFLAVVFSSSSMVSAQTTVVTFDGIATNVRTCTNSAGTSPLGEEISTQFQEQGVVFSVNEFGIAHGSSLPAPKGTAMAGNTIDNLTDRCPIGRFGDNAVLTATFVHPISGIFTNVSNVGVHVADFEQDVHVRTLDENGGVIHDCANVFSGCPFVVQSGNRNVDLSFPGGGIAQVEFIDESPTGFADGFIIDDLAFDLDPVILLEQRVQDLESQIETLQASLNSHRHTYLTGKSTGHNSTEASTGTAEFPD